MKLLILSAAALVASFAATATPVIQVRDIEKAPTVAIVGWDAAQAEFGLRTRLRRDGSHLGDGRAGDHRLYLSSSLVDAKGAIAHATAHNGKLLRYSSVPVRDIDACRFGSCSPNQTVGLAVSDELLRENRDSLVVTLRPKTGRNWTIRLDKRLIDAYLSTIDSVGASLKAEK
jgi:hypothetical protein